ncbi:hypothetical protein MRX96_046506 [Rhipicephalus microplus]
MVKESYIAKRELVTSYNRTCKETLPKLALSRYSREMTAESTPDTPWVTIRGKQPQKTKRWLLLGWWADFCAAMRAACRDSQAERADASEASRNEKPNALIEVGRSTGRTALLPLHKSPCPSGTTRMAPAGHWTEQTREKKTIVLTR